ncbi:MAG: hypothetical protein Q9218_006341 [Villophora microphyllina]
MTTGSVKVISKPGQLGFLDLPTEIRFNIYPYLLKGACTWIVYAGFTPRHEAFRGFFRDKTPLLFLEASRNGIDPSTIHRFKRSLRPEAERWQSDYGTIDEPLYPDILSTCRNIWQEATPTLYSEHIFVFSSESDSNAICPHDVAIESQQYFKDLMSYDIDDWKDTSPFIRDSMLAAFLRKIGPQSSALIRSLKICSSDTDQAASDITLVTQLHHHLRGLEKLHLNVDERDLDYEMSPYEFHPDFSSPWWHNGPFFPMYRALEDFTQRVHWLKELKYSGQRHFAYPEDAMAKLRELIKSVETRAGRHMSWKKVTNAIVYRECNVSRNGLLSATVTPLVVIKIRGSSPKYSRETLT